MVLIYKRTKRYKYVRDHMRQKFWFPVPSAVNWFSLMGLINQLHSVSFFTVWCNDFVSLTSNFHFARGFSFHSTFSNPLHVAIVSDPPLNTLRPRQNCHHFADYILKFIFTNESMWTSISTSLRLGPKRRMNNIPALVQIMAWHRPVDKPLPEPMSYGACIYIYIYIVCLCLCLYVRASVNWTSLVLVMA